MVPLTVERAACARLSRVTSLLALLFSCGIACAAAGAAVDIDIDIDTNRMSRERVAGLRFIRASFYPSENPWIWFMGGAGGIFIVSSKVTQTADFGTGKG
jgi:hypothetical protein